MMTPNVGTLDRLFRAALGLALLYLAFLSGSAVFEGGLLKYGAAIVGIVMVTVAALGSCPVYSLFGIKTCRVLRHGN